MRKKDIDPESHIALIYQILKDNLRKAKKQLLVIKQNREKENLKNLEFQKKLSEAAEKGAKDSLHGQVKEVVDDEGSSVFKFIGS